MIVRVEKFCAEHIKTRVDWINTPVINENIWIELPVTIEKTKQWYDKVKDNPLRSDFTFLSDDGEYLAMGGLTSIDLDNSNAEFYIFVNPCMLGQGIGRTITQWLFNYGFIKYELNKIYLYTNGDNTRALHTYEKAGFVLEGIQREQRRKRDVFIDKYMYGLLREEWSDMNWRKSEVKYRFEF